MKKYLSIYLAIITVTISTLACGLPLGTAEPDSPDQVATIVASTLEALTPEAVDEPTSRPETTANILPHSFYFLGKDNAGLSQVFFIERNGKTHHQVTFEQVNVEYFDVSKVDGSVAYVANNQMLLVDADGKGRRLLVEGGPLNENNPFLNNIINPVFSPNGNTIAYGHQGLNFYFLDTGISNRVLENDIDDLGSGLFVPREMYWPEEYSPDGQKLLITLGYYEGASSAIYYPNGNALVRLKGDEGALICCDQMLWSADGETYHSASPSAGMFNSGLWRVDASNGQVITLFTSNYDTSTFQYADEPYLAPDGQLYYFFLASRSEINTRTPLQIVRSEPDGLTGRIPLRPDTFELMNEALWAPDASFVIVAIAPIQEVYVGGQAEVTYFDDRPSVVLTTYAEKMRWGP
jgi:Tol biopolymer transport system component